MVEPISDIPINNVIQTEGNSLIFKIGEFRLTLKIEGPEPRQIGRLQLESGQTLFDLVLEAARTLVNEFGQSEFTAAELYRTIRERHPDLEIKRNSWNSHVMSSAPNHRSYKHYTSHRNYLRYHDRGKYSLEPNFIS